MPDPIAYVVVVDDDVSVREGLTAVLSDCGYAVDCFRSAEDFLSLKKSPLPNCMILDVHLPGLDGLQLQQFVARDYPSTAVVFVTGHADIPTSVRAIKNGATEFLSKPFDEEQVTHAVQSAVALSQRSMSAAAAMHSLRARYYSLTPREKMILPLVASGFANKNIGFELGISEVTVKAHRGNLMRKLNVGTLAALIQIAIKLQLINDGA